MGLVFPCRSLQAVQEFRGNFVKREYHFTVVGTNLDVSDFLVQSSPEVVIKWTGGGLDDISDFASAVPEPATLLLFGVGLVGLAGVGRKRLLKN